MTTGPSSFLSGNVTPAQPTGSDASSNYPLWLQQFTYDLGNSALNYAQTPYPTNNPGYQVAAPSSNTTAAWNLADENVGSAQPYINQAASLTEGAANPAQPGMINGYAGNFGSTVGGLGSGLSGGINRAGNSAGTNTTGALNQSVTGALPSYLSPYMNNVVGGIESALNTNLTQNVLPGIQDRYVASGQSASPQQMQAENNAVYQNQQALGQSVSQAEQSGYQGALNTALNTANTGFGIGTNQTNNGYSLGSTGYQGALSTNAANTANQLSAGAQLGQLGGLQQQTGNIDVGTLAAAGQAQDSVSQNQLNANYANFQNQQNWVPNQLGYASNIIRGLPVGTTTQTSGMAYPPSGSYQASPLSTFIGTTTAASGLGLRKGGSVAVRRGALSRAA